MTKSDPITSIDIRQLAVNALAEYIIRFLPMHIAHIFWGTAAGNSDWMMGKARKD